MSNLLKIVESLLHGYHTLGQKKKRLAWVTNKQFESAGVYGLNICNIKSIGGYDTFLTGWFHLKILTLDSRW